jgi:Restriction endonuclease
MNTISKMMQGNMMPEPEVKVVHALRADEWENEVYVSLKKGVGRFGWSFMRDAAGQSLGDADLRRLKGKIDANGWSSLTADEQDRYQAFLLELKEGDWVVYVNVPRYGRCTLARVTGPYYWDHNAPADEDFNHRFLVDPTSVRDFDRNDVIVQPRLAARLKLQGRHWHIYAISEFQDLIRDLDRDLPPQRRNSQTNANLLRRKVEPLLAGITKQVQHTNPNYDFEGLLKLVFDQMSSVRNVTLQGGAGDHGADLLVEFEDGLPYPLQMQHTCVVQAKSYEGTMWSLRAVDDIRRAFERHPEADMGLIVSTAEASTPEFEKALMDLRERSGKRVGFLIGADVARFILRYGGPLLGAAEEPRL